MIPPRGETERYQTSLARWENDGLAPEAKLTDETEALTSRQHAWESGLGQLPPSPWTVLHPAKAESGAGDTMTVEKDGGILAKAKKTDPDTVTYTLESPAPETVGSIRIEALRSPGDEPPPTPGLRREGSRGDEKGNFCNHPSPRPSVGPIRSRFLPISRRGRATNSTFGSPGTAPTDSSPFRAGNPVPTRSKE